MLTILSEVEGQYRMTKIKMTKTIGFAARHITAARNPYVVSVITEISV
jgi:hypothetical protein